MPVKILLVEDSTSDALLLQESLAETRLAAFEFTHVECWADALPHIGQPEVFDVLLLDLSLPDISGRETFVRARVEAPHLPIVVLTGQANEGDWAWRLCGRASRTTWSKARPMPGRSCG